MSLTPEQVKHIAMLSRIGVDESELESYSQALTSILGLADKLQAVNTQGVEPLANPLDATQRLRADRISEDNQRERLQSVAPATAKGLFLVPKVIE